MLTVLVDFQKGHAQDFRDRSGDFRMGRKTIPLILSQPVARWSLAAMIACWTVALIMLWQPPLVASLAFMAVGLRCLGGYLCSYEEKDDYVSYCWYGVSYSSFTRSLLRTYTDKNIAFSSGFLEVICCLFFPSCEERCSRAIWRRY